MVAAFGPPARGHRGDRFVPAIHPVRLIDVVRRSGIAWSRFWPPGLEPFASFIVLLSTVTFVGAGLGAAMWSIQPISRWYQIGIVVLIGAASEGGSVCSSRDAPRHLSVRNWPPGAVVFPPVLVHRSHGGERRRGGCHPASALRRRGEPPGGRTTQRNGSLRRFETRLTSSVTIRMACSDVEPATCVRTHDPRWKHHPVCRRWHRWPPSGSR